MPYLLTAQTDALFSLPGDLPWWVYLLGLVLASPVVVLIFQILQARVTGQQRARLEELAAQGKRDQEERQQLTELIRTQGSTTDRLLELIQRQSDYAARQSEANGKFTQAVNDLAASNREADFEAKETMRSLRETIAEQTRFLQAIPASIHALGSEHREQHDGVMEAIKEVMSEFQAISDELRKSRNEYWKNEKRSINQQTEMLSSALSTLETIKNQVTHLLSITEQLERDKTHEAIEPARADRVADAAGEQPGDGTGNAE